MTYVLAILLTLLNAIWLLLVAIGLPGTWLMVVSTLLVAWWQWEPGLTASEQMFSVWVLIAIGVIALIGEILELLAGVFGSAKAGGTKRGAAGALLGTLVGGVAGTLVIPIPVLGSLIGACGGAALGAWGVELYIGRTMEASVKSGVGAGVGRFVGTLTKLVAGVLIWIIVAVAAFWP